MKLLIVESPKKARTLSSILGNEYKARCPVFEVWFNTYIFLVLFWRNKILINDKVVISEILLESGSKEYYLDLSVGFNKIEFEALNQGSSGPNTAAFKVFDDKGILITSNEWNLTTGVKASIVIVNETKK